MRGYRLGSKERLNPKASQDSQSEHVTGPKPDNYERKRVCGTAEAYSFGCTCELCMTNGRSEYLRKVVA